jgi:hypothetical protein
MGDRMRYVEVDGAEPTVSIEVNGNNYVFTHDSLVNTINKDEAYKIEIKELERKMLSLKYDVREFFQSRYETDHPEIVAEVDDVNQLLKDIGIDELTKSWSATVSITATVTGIEAPNADAAREIIEDAFEINLTVDGDVWVDDLTVESCYPEA